MLPTYTQGFTMLPTYPRFHYATGERIHDQHCLSTCVDRLMSRGFGIKGYRWVKTHSRLQVFVIVHMSPILYLCK